MIRLLFSFFFLTLLTSCFELKGVKSRYKLINTGKATDVSVMSFNILSTWDLGAITNGYPTWWKRRCAVFTAIDEHDPDLLSLQELSLSQFEEIRDRYGERYFVLHKKALTTDAVILVKRDRFTILEKGFWSLENMSSTLIRRIVVWAKVRENASGRELMFLGTHLDARHIKLAEITFINRQIEKDKESGAPLIFAGDLNATSETDFYAAVLGGGWKDSYLGDLKTEVKTFPLKNPTRRIDHIFFMGGDVESKHWERVDNKGFPFSDHFPVFVQFHIKEAP